MMPGGWPGLKNFSNCPGGSAAAARPTVVGSNNKIKAAAQNHFER
jgi:hypothetical protein